LKLPCCTVTLALLAAALPACAQFANTVNDNSTIPAAPAGMLNVIPQNDGGKPTVRTTHYVLYPTVQVNCPMSGDLSGPVNSAIGVVLGNNGGIVDARRCQAATSWTNPVTIDQDDTVLLLPCTQLVATQALTIAPGTRNVTIHGCSYQGGSAASGLYGGTVWAFQASGPAFLIGDPTHALDTTGFHMDNMVVATVSAPPGASAFAFYRTKQIRLDNLYLEGDQGTDQTAILLDGTGDYTGGTFTNISINGFNEGWFLTGHVSGSVQDDYANASTFVNTHVVCPTSGGSPIAGTGGVVVYGGDGNTWIGGDIESCYTMFQLGPFATANTIVGLRNENSHTQYLANTGSSFNSVVTGGTLYTGQLSDSGSRNSFLDAFHRTFNGIAGDWYASQQNATITNHLRLGTGTGDEQGLLTEVQTDYGYRWENGFTSGTSGEQFWNLDDLLNAVSRISVGQYLTANAHTVTNIILNNGGCYSTSTPPTLTIANGGGITATGTPVMATSTCSGGWQVLSVTMTNNGTNYTTQPALSWAGSNQLQAPNAVAEIATTGGTNMQTALNAAGTGAVVLNGSSNAGTGGTVFGSGGASPSTVATIDSGGDGTLFGYLRFFASAAEQWRFNCASSAACNIDDWTTGSAVHRIRLYANAGTELDSNAASAVTVNNTSGSGTGGFIVYEGGSNSTVAAFTVTGAGATQQPGNSQVGSSSGTGNVVLGNHLNQIANADFAGSCAMATAVSCTVSFQHSWTSYPACSVTPQFSPLYLWWYTWATNVVTVHSVTATSGTFAVVCVGDPN
jgi:hypothetical protein